MEAEVAAHKRFLQLVAEAMVMVAQQEKGTRLSLDYCMDHVKNQCDDPTTTAIYAEFEEAVNTLQV